MPGAASAELRLLALCKAGALTPREFAAAVAAARPAPAGMGNGCTSPAGDRSRAGSGGRKGGAPPPPQAGVMMPDPRRGGATGPAVGVIAFYYPGRMTPWDDTCRAPFLGNFWEVPGGVTIAPPGREPVVFRNTEAGFQALKWWTRAADFAPRSGHEAFELKKSLRGTEDYTYGGFGSNWAGMYHVLRAKFGHGSPLAAALLSTDDAFLLEHNTVQGRDKVWSDNVAGDGTNWLGLQLMSLRDDLRGAAGQNPSAWRAFIASSVDMRTGAPLPGQQAWQRAVRTAAEAAVQRWRRP